MTKSSTMGLIPGLALDLNPFSSRVGSARVIRNFIPERGRLMQKTFSPPFTVMPDTASGQVWQIENFRYTRAGAQENQVIVFRSDGKVYRRQASYEQQIFPITISSVTSIRSPGTTANVDNSGGTAWSNVANIAASDDTYSSVTLFVPTDSDYLQATNFGFAVPSNQSILSVAVTVEGNTTAGATAGYFFKAQLISATAGIGTVQFGSHLDFTTDVVQNISGSATWSAALTPGLVNSSDFGVQIWFESVGHGGATATVNIDHITMLVEYGTAQELLVKKPFVGQLGNRLFFSDGTRFYVYDGLTVQRAGLERPNAAPTAFTAQNLGGSIVAATGVKGSFTWVVQDEEGNRVHESSRSDITNFVIVGGADDSVRMDISGFTPPTRATHWSAYLSELDGSDGVVGIKRAATTRILTTTVDITAFPAATSPTIPIRNDPPRLLP